MNGKASSQSEVKKFVVGKLSIDVDNLCSFMPQDKVGNFTRFSPKEVLENTLKSIAVNDEGRTLRDEQLELANVEATKMDHRRDLNLQKGELEAQKLELRGLEAEKERMRQRNEDKELLHVYSVLKVYLEAADLSVVIEDKQRTLDQAAQQLQDEVGRIAPLESRERDLRKSEAARTKALQTAGQQLTKAEGALSDRRNALQGQEERVEELSVELEQQQGAQRRAQQALQTAQQELVQLQQRLEAASEALPEVQQLLETCKRQEATVGQEIAAMSEELDQLQQQEIALQESSRQTTRQLHGLQDPRQLYRMKLLGISRGFRDWHPQKRSIDDCIKAMDWMDANLERLALRGQVLGPVAMHCDVLCPAAALCMERCVGTPKLLGFLVEHNEDASLLIRELKPLRLFVDIFTMTHREVPPQALAADKLKTDFQQWGLQGYLSDFLRCPDLVRVYLCNFGHLNNIPLSRFDSVQLPDELLQRLGSALLSRGALTMKMFNHEPNPRRPSNGTMSIGEYSCRKSRYAGNAPLSISSSRVLGSLGLLRVTAGAGEGEGDVGQQRQALTTALDRLAQQQQDLHERIGEKQQKMALLASRLASCRQDRLALLSRQREPQELAGKVAQQSRKIATLTQKVSVDAAAQRLQLQETYRQGAQTLMGSLEACLASAALCLQLSRGKAVCSAARDELQERLGEAVRDLQVARAGIRKLEHTVKAAQGERDEAQEKRAAKERQLKDLQQEVGSKERFLDILLRGRQLPEKTVQAVETRIKELEERIGGGEDNQRVLDRYEALLDSVQELTARVETAEARLQQEEAHLEQRAQQWLQEVQAIAAKMNDRFADYMAELNYAGEVVLNQVGTFDTYELQMRVSFRHQGKLVDLSASVQSGGERAVATVMYLMALQDMASSPFRVVDEINQGMDQTNERLVFDRIVQSCCRDAPEGLGRPQYFLVTPKLLQGLRAMDNDHVTVLLVFNGPGVGSKWQLTQVLRRLREKEGGRAAEVTTSRKRTRL